MIQNNINYVCTCIFSIPFPIVSTALCYRNTLFKQCEREGVQAQPKAQINLNATTISQAIVSQVKNENGQILREFITYKFLATVGKSVDGLNI